MLLELMETASMTQNRLRATQGMHSMVLNHLRITLLGKTHRIWEAAQEKVVLDFLKAR